MLKFVEFAHRTQYEATDSCRKFALMFMNE